MPKQSLDLFTEFKCRTNDLDLPNGAELLGALAYYGLPAIDSAQKEAFRDLILILSRESWSPDEKAEIVDYCESDLRSLIVLLKKMLSEIDWPRAFLRGEYMESIAPVECGRWIV